MKLIRACPKTSVFEAFIAHFVGHLLEEWAISTKGAIKVPEYGPLGQTLINRRGFGFRSLLGLLVGSLLYMGRHADGQVVLVPNQINGTIQFRMTNLLESFSALGVKGLVSAAASARSVGVEPALISLSEFPYHTPKSPVEVDYQLTVSANAEGIVYAVGANAYLDASQQRYEFANVNSAPVRADGPPVAVHFSECVGLLRVRFMNAQGQPVPVSGGTIKAFLPSDPPTLQAEASSLPPGRTDHHLAVRGGETFRVEVRFTVGTNPRSDQVTFEQISEIAVPCDSIATLVCSPSTLGNLGKITGNVDLVGESEHHTSVGEGYPERTRVRAELGPFDNFREAVVDATPSSGPFVLLNLVPSAVVDPAAAYRIWADMHIRTGRRFQIFQTPILGSGENLPVIVAAGTEQSLGNTFVIRPGFVTGQIFLKGPPEVGSYRSALRGVSHASDFNENADGVPDAAAIYGIYGSSVNAYGIDRKALGAAHTASGGWAGADFDGSFSAADSAAFTGNYELALGGLFSERSVWQVQAITVQFGSGVGPENADSYVNNTATISDLQAPALEIGPGEQQAHDLRYCFSEVRLSFRTTSGRLFNPRVRFSDGRFEGVDFENRAIKYAVSLDAAHGTPNTAETASPTGLVVLYAPAGEYSLHPFVTVINQDNTQSQVELAPVPVTVGCGQRIALEPCFQVRIQMPECVVPGPVQIGGSVLSCGKPVASLTYQLNNSEPQSVCQNCGADPGFTLNLALTPGEHSLTVTATDGENNRTFVETHLVAAQPVPGSPCHPASSPPPIQIEPPAEPGGDSEVRVEIPWPGQPGDCAIIQTSDDLETWEDVAQVVVGTEGTAPFTETFALTRRQRFFRAVPCPDSGTGTLYYQRLNETSGKGTIWQLDLASGADRQLTDGHFPRVSADGRLLVFQRIQGGLRNLIVRNLANGEEKLILETQSEIIGYTFAQDGSEVVLDMNGALQRMSSDGAIGPELVFANECRHAAPSISRSRVIVFHERTPGRLSQANRDGTAYSHVTSEGPGDSWPQWSPDNNFIALVDGNNFPTRVDLGRNLLVISADLRTRRQLTFLGDTDGFPYGAVWSSNGGVLYGAATIKGVSGIYRVPARTQGEPVFMRVGTGDPVHFVGGVAP